MWKKIHNVSSLITFAYILIYITMVFISITPRFLAEYSTINVSKLAENLELPLDIFAWGFLAVCSGYAGIDRKYLLDKSLVDKNVKFADSKRLLVVIGLLVLILFQSIFFNMFLSKDVKVLTDIGTACFKGINLPIDGIATAIVSACSIGVIGSPTGTKGKVNEKEVDGNVGSADVGSESVRGDLHSNEG